MKKIHIVALIIIAVAIGSMVATLSQSSTYANLEIAQANPDKEFHVVGKLLKEKEMLYQPEVDANKFSFFMIDNQGKECKVNFKGTKPQDFERSEQIVIIGKYHEGEFYANSILMKCPSKYNDGTSELTEIKANA